MRKFFRFVLIILNIVAAACLLLVYLCCFVSPETVWWLSFIGLGYKYLLGANLLFILVWMLSRRWKFALLSLVSILAGWNIIWRNIQLCAEKLPEAEQDKTLSIITYNVHGFVQGNSVQPDGGKLNIFDYLQSKNADVICLQEYMYSPWEKDLYEKNIRKRLGKTPYSCIEHTIGTSGIATFSKHPIIRKKIVYSDNTTNACIYCDLLVGTDTIRVYNMHLKSIGFDSQEWDFLNNAVKREYSDSDVRTLKTIIHQMKNSYVKRARQVEQITEHIAKSPYPVVICGDFNDPPASYSYQRMSENRKEAFVESGKGWSTTFNIGRISSQRIDYIMYSPVFKAYDYESPRVYLSDHYPVMCRLTNQ